MMSLIEYRKVTKKYNDDTVALNDVSIGIDRGEFVFLVGPSGAGKSTLVRLLIKEEVPTSGEILFEEQPLNEIVGSEVASLRRKIGVVFQDYKLLESKNVFENAAVSLDVVDSPQEVINDVVPNVLGLVGLLEKMHNFPHQLSGGEKQRLSIARALAHEPDVLVADEPTGMIDPKSSFEVVDVLEQINSLGTTVLMATHDESIVDKLKKRVVRIEDGAITSDEKKGTYNGKAK